MVSPDPDVRRGGRPGRPNRTARGRQTQRQAHFAVHDPLRWVGLASLLALALVGLSEDATRPLRDRLLIRSSTSVGPRHLEYAPAADEARDEFLRARSDVQVVVPWNMTGEELLNLYMLRTHPTAPAVVAAESGGLSGTLLQGASFQIDLNERTDGGR